MQERTFTRIYAISDPADVADPAYRDGLRAAVSAALDYGIDAIGSPSPHPPPVPVALLGQARFAARSGIGLDTVLRRYCAGHSLLAGFVLERGEDGDRAGRAEQQSALAMLSVVLDRLLAAVAAEYRREREERQDSSEERRGALIEALLGGEMLLDRATFAAEFGYRLDAHHLGLLATGPGAEAALRDLAAEFDCLLLTLARADGSLWAWLGASRPLARERLEDLASPEWPRALALAVGQPAEGLAGWRLTHRQARAALPVALGSRERVARYADVALLASARQDDLLVASLRQLYLAPLERERDGGRVAKETLRAYFDAERNVSSAAAGLGVSRQAVAKRLCAIEQRIGRPLGDAAVEMEIALRLECHPNLAGMLPAG